jgi:SAM-dependent methyltransferase
MALANYFVVDCYIGSNGFVRVDAGSSIWAKHIDRIRVRGNIFSARGREGMFSQTFDFVKKYNERTNYLLMNKTIFSEYNEPSFLISDMCNLPFANQTFSHINCCGSVLSLIEDSHSALFEMSRVLKKGGTLFIEVESKWNLDRLWTFIDVLLKNRLGYYSSFKEALDPITSLFDDIRINYPYREPGEPVFIRIKLFDFRTLRNEFSLFQLRIVKRWTIHSVTNFIPSIFLDTDFPSRTLRRLFNILSYIEEKIPFCFPGCSMVYLLKKE